MQSTKNDLLNEKYDENMQDKLLKQYEIFVESSERVSEKRMSANKFYLGLNTALFGIAGYILILSNRFIAVVLSFIGIFICLAWISNISSYKRLNSAKFKVIHKLEEHLPAKPFKLEDEYLGSFYSLTRVERFIPILFIILYVLILGLFLPELILSFIKNINLGGLI